FAMNMVPKGGLAAAEGIDLVYTGLSRREKLYEDLLSSAEPSLPTYHEQINIAKVREYAYGDASLAIDELLEINTHHDNAEVVQKMKQIIPEFLSKNSIYEVLDKTG